ncbi:MAG: 23S rRNA (guanosine(2251)-2'-O)-methyltransferase RlmB [Ignavibacteriaceae bacterium]|nr:23S rRNA (guanosine(2251)-2'-O)-methyltransferase RlmB [Ignavibacteriaceae bacterium]
MNIIVGRKPVLEAINSGEQIEQVYILHGQKGPAIDAIRIASKKRGIKCNEISNDKLRTITTHPNAQGVAASKTEQKYYSLSEIISTSKQSSYPLVLILDSIQDTHNLGAILRTAECSGVDGIIITKHNSAPVNDTVAKTSAGATEHVKICVVNNLAQAMKELRDSGFWIAGSSLDNSKDYSAVDFKIPLALVVGNEEKGIRKLTADNCDFLINIPMKGKIQSLNVSVATGILLFEVLRQRKSI